MMHLDESTRAELIREIAQTLAKTQRLAFASDFHAYAEGRQLTLAGVTFETFAKGPNTRRSDGDVVAHAIVMALVAAVNQEDIVLGTVDVTILCGEQPRMKRRLPEMQRNIAEGLGISLEQVHVKVSSMDGQDEIARLEGIEARVLICLWQGL